ncbi:MAG: hypothetical protein HKO95_17650 [Rhodobacteraceae bacterium]|nr:hypothetical protein [Alphaproteobacteria bacterium]NNK68552.1 hypothetical protein [Paracoccaceae bacterium]
MNKAPTVSCPWQAGIAGPVIGHAIGRAEIKRVMCGCLISCVATAASPRNAASPAPDEWRQWAGRDGQPDQSVAQDAAPPEIRELP